MYPYTSTTPNGAKTSLTVNFDSSGVESIVEQKTIVLELDCTDRFKAVWGISTEGTAITVGAELALLGYYE